MGHFSSPAFAPLWQKPYRIQIYHPFINAGWEIIAWSATAAGDDLCKPFKPARRSRTTAAKVSPARVALACTALPRSLAESKRLTN